MDVTFFFDPSCPWTWRTSRWLVEVAPVRDLSLRWRSFSLGLLSDRAEPAVAAAARALRLVEALWAEGRHADAGRFYTEIGARTHEVDTTLTDDLARSAAEAAELDPGPLDDPAWDSAVRRSHDTGFGSAGPDVGSPVLLPAGAPRALHGPVLAELPDPAAAAELWDIVHALARTPAFYELKRGRR